MVISSRLSDLNQLPARYEGAALPGELNRQKYFMVFFTGGRYLRTIILYLLLFRMYVSYR